jgi:hypothetical protein
VRRDYRPNIMFEFQISFSVHQSRSFQIFQGCVLRRAHFDFKSCSSLSMTTACTSKPLIFVSRILAHRVSIIRFKLLFNFLALIWWICVRSRSCHPTVVPPFNPHRTRLDRAIEASQLDLFQASLFVPLDSFDCHLSLNPSPLLHDSRPKTSSLS